jgi:hypothetical protein
VKAKQLVSSKSKRLKNAGCLLRSILAHDLDVTDTKYNPKRYMALVS